MSTEIAILTQAELDLLNSLSSDMGASTEDLTGGGGNFLPQLKVWTEDDSDEDGAPRLKGKLFITGQEPLVYAKPGTVKFRALTQAFQMTKYDKETNKTVNKTRLMWSFKEEPRDEKGTLRCGKPPSKDLRDNKALQEIYKDVTTFRRLQGFVSYTGVTAEGEEVEVKDVLVGVNHKGANFTAFEDEVVKQMPEKTNLWDFASNITLSKEKNGSVTYWVMHFEPDFANKLPMTVPIITTIADLKGQIDATNKAIDKKYYEAINTRNGDDDALAALKSVGAGSGRPGKLTLDDDLNDDIPF